MEGKGRLGSERVCFHGLGRAKLSGASSGFRGAWASFMHCSAAVWCFSLLAAAALGASAAAGLVAPCWNFWSLALACFNHFQQCSRFPFLAKTGSVSTSIKALIGATLCQNKSREIPGVLFFDAEQICKMKFSVRNINFSRIWPGF